MPMIRGQYERIKEPRLQCAYEISYEVGDVISWAAEVYRGRELVGKPNGRIELANLSETQYETAVIIAATASIENGISLHE